MIPSWRTSTTRRISRKWITKLKDDPTITMLVNNAGFAFRRSLLRPTPEDGKT